MKKNFKRILLIGLLVFIVAGLFLAVGCTKKDGSDGKSKQLYTCGMHPEVIRDKPGLCPICGMKLVPLTSSGVSPEEKSGERKILYWTDPMMNPPYISDKPGKSPMGMDLVPVYEDQVSGGAGVTIDPAVIQNIGVRYAQVARGPLEKTIRAPAHVDFNEDHLAVLSVRAEGWIEKLYIKTPGVSVKAGQPLFRLYSPKLYSAQEEYRIAIRSGDSSLANAARERLKLLGISDAEINSIKSNGTKRTLAINSPINGVVVYIGSSSAGTGSQSGASSSGSGMSGMSGRGGGSGGGATGMNSQSGATIREGDFVAAGTAVFTIADLSSLWIYAHIFEDDLPYVKIGMKALLELDYLPGEKFEGKVDFIYPFLDKQTRDIKLRMTIQNPDGKLMPEMYGKVSLDSKITDDALIIPSEAVLFSGDRRIVFISLPGGRFIPQDVVLGPSDGKGNVQVISGLYEGQTVVTSAQFLIDSESHLKEALEKMLSENSGKAKTQNEENPETAKAEEWPNLAPDDPRAKFACPMPDDRYYAAEPGDCPICGMHLVPHNPEDSDETHPE
jgi:Cu(I)/Ag(I) efflux system membrane fusion protein/cobalt-zinc-cadmium efflux system membrane fusion protein